jgi:hypothetical protein
MKMLNEELENSKNGFTQGNSILMSNEIILNSSIESLKDQIH